ncbi:uncharacterized protein G2W53_043101 [Senna tora]|uniref:Uncharacterized protein n=1 Tax=Senna tora TaxID=362788 RepID=A0A834W0D8_9FABA|nr:uncharacterized protein G2W53_043101 [Senna tora]
MNERSNMYGEWEAAVIALMERFQEEETEHYSL